MNEDIQPEELLAEMDQIAREAGDWHDHIPFEAACAFNSNKDIRSLYIRHVSGCEHCQEVVELFDGPKSNRLKD